MCVFTVDRLMWSSTPISVLEEAAGDGCEHITLATGDLGHWRAVLVGCDRACGEVLDQSAGDRGREQRVAGGDHADCVAQLVG